MTDKKETPLGNLVIVWLCHHCDYHWTRDDLDPSEYEDYREGETLYDDDNGCPMCRFNKGFTPYLTFK